VRQCTQCRLSKCWMDASRRGEIMKFNINMVKSIDNHLNPYKNKVTQAILMVYNKLSKNKMHPGGEASITSSILPQKN